MFDNLRRQAAASPQDDDEFDAEAPSAASEASRPTPGVRTSAGRVLGMTPQQLFLLSLMLFLNVTVLSCFALVAFERVRLF